MVTRYTQGMGTTSTVYQAVREQALKLGEDERELLMVELAASIEAGREPGYEATWATEIRRRLDDIDQGKAELLDEDHLDAFVWGEGARESA